MEKKKDKYKKKNKLPEGDNFIATKLLGKGSYGTVYLGETKDTKETCAIKEIIIKKSRNERKMVLRELKIMEKIKHENCVDLFFIEPKNYQKADLVYIVMEYCDMGDLKEYINSKTNISIEEVKEIFGQMVIMMQVLDKNRIVHRDLKPQNILLLSNPQSNFEYTLKLADFGLAREIPKEDEKNEGIQTLVGTPLYMAPEILSNKPYTSNVDLWSLGVILYEIVTTKCPFLGFKLSDLSEHFRSFTKKSLPKEYLKIVPKECNDLVEKLLTVDPNSRITRKELYNHSFISAKLKNLSNNFVDNTEQEKEMIGVTKETFQSTENGKLSFKKEDVIEIIKINKDEGICEGKLKEKEGIIELKKIDLYKEIPDIFSMIQSNNNNNNNQLINFEKRIIGISKFEYKSNEISLSKGDLVKIIKINQENDYCKIKFRNQKDEILLFFLIFYEIIEKNDEINENDNENDNEKKKKNKKNKNKNKNKNQLVDEITKKKFGIAKVNSGNDDDDDDDNFLSFSKGDEVKIIEDDGEMGIGKLNGKEGEIFMDDFDIQEN